MGSNRNQTMVPCSQKELEPEAAPGSSLLGVVVLWGHCECRGLSGQGCCTTRVSLWLEELPELQGFHLGRGL